jgi:hypothetical protein
MIRTVPSSANEEIQLYMRTYYSLLRSSRPVEIKTLEEAHKSMNSALHVKAGEPEVDMAAFIYSVLRMPDCLDCINLVVMGQSELVFCEHDFCDIEQWQRVYSPGRRRRSFFDGKSTLAVYIASRSDIDDIVPILTAYQIERGKLHLRLNNPAAIRILHKSQQEDGDPSYVDLQALAEITEISVEDLGRLSEVWGFDTASRLLTIAEEEQEISIRSLAGSLADYKRATRRWWQNVERHQPELDFTEHPIYFISSNTHSMPNLLSGYALAHEEKLKAYIETSGSAGMLREYHDIQESNVPSSMENYLYYVLKKYNSEHPADRLRQFEYERSIGISRVPSGHAFDIEVQVVQLNLLNTGMMDPRLQIPGIEALSESQALIINIDYPLGLAAYQVLTEIARNVAHVRGVYVMGKAATLNGRIGDVMIPGIVHDEHSLNTYLFDNAIKADAIDPHLIYGTVLDNQKAITAPGTFLQNEGYMSVFYREGFTDLEMEAGPYLSGIYEMVRPIRHPYNEIVDLHNAPFPIGFVHYASDTPFSKGMNLGAANLSYFGMDPTYASMIAILRTIFDHEIRQVKETRASLEV